MWDKNEMGEAPKRGDAKDKRDGTRGESKGGVEGGLEHFTRITVTNKVACLPYTHAPVHVELQPQPRTVDLYLLLSQVRPLCIIIESFHCSHPRSPPRSPPPEPRAVDIKRRNTEVT